MMFKYTFIRLCYALPMISADDYNRARTQDKECPALTPGTDHAAGSSCPRPVTDERYGANGSISARSKRALAQMLVGTVFGLRKRIAYQTRYERQRQKTFDPRIGKMLGLLSQAPTLTSLARLMAVFIQLILTCNAILR